MGATTKPMKTKASAGSNGTTTKAGNGDWRGDLAPDVAAELERREQLRDSGEGEDRFDRILIFFNEMRANFEAMAQRGEIESVGSHIRAPKGPGYDPTCDITIGLLPRPGTEDKARYDSVMLALSFRDET